MPSFKYTALSNKGTKIRGNYTATTASDVAEMLKHKKYYPVEISEDSGYKDTEGIMSKFTKIKAKDLAVFCRQFQAMLNAGIPIINCLDIVQQQTEKKKFKIIIADIYEQLQKGYTFSEALKQHADVFPNIMISMVETGELSGNLDVIMTRLAEHFEKEFKIENKVKSAMAYPVILVIVTLLVVIFMLTQVLPTFVSMFESSGVELPLPTRIMMSISDFIIARWYVLVFGVTAIALAMTKIETSQELKIKQDKFKLTRIPIYKDVSVKIVSARFTRTMATLIGSGVELLTAIEVTSRVTGNKYVEQILGKVADDVKKGVGMSEPIRRYNIFPPMIPSMIKIGEDSGALEDILDKTADFYDEELDSAIQKLTSMIEPLMIVVMAVIVGSIIIAMMMPMFDMVKTVQ
jgi:type IV pilus assembly protein PilC